MFGFEWLTVGVVISIYLTIAVLAFVLMWGGSFIQTQSKYLSTADDPQTIELMRIVKQDWDEWYGLYLWGSLGWILFYPFILGVYILEQLSKIPLYFVEKSIKKHKDNNAEKYV